MKNIFIIISVLLAGLVSAQKKKTTKPPLIVRPKIIAAPKVEEPDYENRNREKKCFIYTAKEQKDSLVHVTENLLEYGWNGSNARIVITSYDYDATEKNKADKDGNQLILSKSMKFINGEYVIEKDRLFFTPDKSDKFEKRKFKIFYKAKSKKVNHLEDENEHQFKTGDCIEPTIMTSM